MTPQPIRYNDKLAVTVLDIVDMHQYLSVGRIVVISLGSGAAAMLSFAIARTTVLADCDSRAILLKSMFPSKKEHMYICVSFNIHSTLQIYNSLP